MMFEHNEQFAEYFNRAIDKPSRVTPMRYLQSKIKIKGWLGKVWRWFYNQQISTSEAYGTITHKEVAEGIKHKGWKVVEYSPPGRTPPPEYMCRQLASEMQREIPQLSDKTQIATHIKYNGYPIQCVQMGQGDWVNFYVTPPNIIECVPMIQHEIEWKQFVVQYKSDTYYGAMDYYVFVAAYDMMEDCLYLDNQK